MTAPSKLLFLAEGRGLLESAVGLFASRFIKSPKGDGIVIVLPSLGAGDISSKPLRLFLDTLGYKTYGWGLGLNKGLHGNRLGEVIALVKEVYAVHNRKISLVGHDLGGIMAREVAKVIPDMIKQVITVGSPFNGSLDDTYTGVAYRILNGTSITDQDREYFLKIQGKPDVPCTNIFSKKDGVVAWQCAIDENLHKAENIEIIGASHTGMMNSPQGLYLIANRLAEPENAWRPFVITQKTVLFFRV